MPHKHPHFGFNLPSRDDSSVSTTGTMDPLKVTQILDDLDALFVDNQTNPRFAPLSSIEQLETQVLQVREGGYLIIRWSEMPTLLKFLAWAKRGRNLEEALKEAATKPPKNAPTIYVNWEAVTKE